MSRASRAQLVDTTGSRVAPPAPPRGGLDVGGRRSRGRRFAFLPLLVVWVAAWLLGPRVASAAEPEPLLFLGIQRSTTIDKLASSIIVEHLQDRGESLVPTTGLTDTDRRCRRLQCLNPVAAQRKAALVLDGDVQQVGQNRTLRVVMHLYDARQRQQHELENLCVDCDETKLGIVLANTTTDLLGQFRKTAAAMDQLAALLDATPVAMQDRAPAAGKSAGGPAVSPSAASPSEPPTPAQTPEPARPDPAGSPTEPARPAPGAVAQSPQAPASTPAPTPTQALPFPAPLPISPAGVPVGLPGAYPTPMPPLPLAEAPPLRATRGRLSTKRKIIAGVFGAVGAGTLAAAIILNILDLRLASNRTYNPSGSPCIDPQYAGQNCVLSTVRLWAPGYAVGGLLLGGMILTLTVPEGSKSSRD